jgi:DNA-nicking Smr family endonuclease
MKRPQSFSMTDPPPAPRRRSLSEEERALWESVARQVKPLRKKPRVGKATLGKSAIGKAAIGKAAAAIETDPPNRPAPSPRPISAQQAPRPSKPAMPPLAPLGRRERSKLSRGRSEIDARLDLHGMTQSRAHRVLLGFLHNAHHDGHTFVLVITGKGKVGGGEAERGVLRRQVPQWLSSPELRSLVVGFEEAHIGHGGEGALYVRIRRAR